MKIFTEEMRYDLPLAESSVVLDVGCYHGQWSRLISEKYNCHVIAFEPIGEFYRIAKKTLEPFPKVRLFNMGVGASHRKDTFHIHGDMTSKFADGPPEEVEIRDIVEVVEEFGRVRVPEYNMDFHPFYDAVKINAEGSEMEIMERLLDAKLAHRINHFSIQPHTCVPDYAARWQRIMDRLAETHETDYFLEWTWYGATRRK